MSFHEEWIKNVSARKGRRGGGVVNLGTSEGGRMAKKVGNHCSTVTWEKRTTLGSFKIDFSKNHL